MGKVKVVMEFEVEAPLDYTNQTPEEFMQQCAAWVKDDPAGWILSRPVKERFATEVAVTLQD